MNRMNRLPLATSASSQMTRSAGTSDGEVAPVAARRIAVAADALHDRAAASPAKNSQGSRRWVSTAARRPDSSAARKGGENVQSRAASARNQERSVSRVAHNHDARAASGRAATNR